VSDDETVTLSAESFEMLMEGQDRIEDLTNLIRWLAIPYNGRTPIFAREDLYSGEPLMANIALEHTWRTVMGTTEAQAPGRWVRCPTCASMYVDSMSPQ
jgi:hypothetical protein